MVSRSKVAQRWRRSPPWVVAEPSDQRAERERAQRGLVTSLVALAAFGLIYVVVRDKRSQSFDVAVTRAVQRGKAPWLAKTMGIVSWPGFPPQSRMIPPGLALLLWRLGLPVAAVCQGLAWGAAMLASLIKFRMKRPRPDHPLINVVIARIGGTSFPSGHVLNYVSVFGFLSYIAETYLRPARVRRAVTTLLVGLIALVGPSRIYLGHHWTTDVLASYFLGTSYLIGLIEFYRTARARLGRD